nr:hypothetical protein [uncultured bacterium]
MIALFPIPVMINFPFELFINLITDKKLSSRIDDMLFIASDWFAKTKFAVLKIEL